MKGLIDFKDTIFVMAANDLSVLLARGKGFLAFSTLY